MATTQRRITARADSLLILAYRCWHAGFDYSDAECWQYAWVVLSNEFGAAGARPILSAMEDFVRTLRQVSQRRLDYFPPPCCRASDSEHVVLELVAALQSGEPRLATRIEALCGDIGEAAADRVLGPARALAASFLDVGMAIAADRSASAAAAARRHLH